jgi:hypothetical protein
LERAHFAQNRKFGMLVEEERVEEENRSRDRVNYGPNDQTYVLALADGTHSH